MLRNPNARRVPYSSLQWNESAQRFTQPSGRFLSASSVREVMEADLSATATAMLSHGDSLKVAAQAFKDGSLDQAGYNREVRLWRDKMATSVKALHLGNVAMAAGGFHNMDAESHGRAGGLIGAQARWLSNFAVEAAGNPDIVLSLDKSRRPFDERVKMYAEAGRNSFERERRVQHQSAGFAGVENVLEDGAHHCTGPRSCPAMTALGRVEVDDARFLVPGSRKCGPLCKCQVTYYKATAST